MEPMNEQHARALAKYADEYRRAGFDIVVEPDDAALPVFLRGFRPDLIATSKENNYVLELKIGERSGQQGKWSALAAAVEAQPGWHFRLVILSHEGKPFLDVENTPRDAITRLLDSVKALDAIGHKKAALLIAWSGFEAAARHRLLKEGIAPKDVSPLATIKYLVHVGILSQDEMRQVNEIMQIRNAIAHGFERPINALDINKLEQLAQLLLSAQE